MTPPRPLVPTNVALRSAPLLAAASLVLLGAAAPARGDDACAAEVARLCPRARGDVETLSCLRANEPALSKACRGDLDAVLAKAREISADCEADVREHCRDVKPGEGRVAACLKAHESELSQWCQKAFNAWRVGRMELVAACAGDVGKHCNQIPEGGGRIWVCLKEHLPDLSSECRAAIEKL